MDAWLISDDAKLTGQGIPMMSWPRSLAELPKLMLYPHSVQMSNVMAKAYRTISAELRAHFRFINPAYRIARPGTLWRPTSVAAVSCQAVSPEFSQSGLGTSPSRN